jgi:hypothetical protein
LSHSGGSPFQKRQRIRRLEDLADESGPPLTTNELAQMIGMSATFIRVEIRDGHLQAVPVGRGGKRVFRIPVREACRYIRKLGFL